MSTVTLHSEKKMTSVPQLRFSEFKGEWEKIQLGKLAQKIGDGLHGTPKYSEDSDINFINGNNLTNGKIEITEKTKKVEHTIFIKNDKGLNENTILISLNGTIGNIAKYNHEKVMLGKSVGYFNFKENTNFYFHVFHTDKIQNFFISELTGSTIKNLSLKTLRETIFPFPTLPEQQKIASFLSAIDEKIQQLSRKKELVEQYKKGIMQQVFSGKLRFKDENGNDYPDWEIIKVQELINKKAIISLLDGNHGALYPKSEEFVSEGIPYVAANNLVNGQVKFSECKYLPEERAKKFKKGVAKNGDVLFAHNATVGPTALLKTELDYIILSTTVTYYRCDLNILSNTYLLHYFNSDNFIFQYTKVMSQSTRNQVPITMQKKFEIDFPSLPEQQKIANFLSGIDGKIEQVNGELVKTQEFKKGLLQQLFV